LTLVDTKSMQIRHATEELHVPWREQLEGGGYRPNKWHGSPSLAVATWGSDVCWSELMVEVDCGGQIYTYAELAAGRLRVEC
jgi:hypothetical protein